MRTILATVITCLLLPSVSVTAQSANKQQDVSVSDSEPKNTRTAKKDSNNNSEESLDFSDTGRPGQQTAGESRGNCANFAQIEALLPVSKSGTTVQGHPSFWVYFSDTIPQASQVEFIIQNEAREDVWRVRSQLDTQPGYKKFTLPETEAPLEIDQWYRWYVKVYCDSQVASVQYVQGWVKRIFLTSQLDLELKQSSHNPHIIYGNHSIWYDAIDELLNSYQSNPTDLALEKDWQNLVGAKGVSLQLLPSIGDSYKADNP